MGQSPADGAGALQGGPDGDNTRGSLMCRAVHVDRCQGTSARVVTGVGRDGRSRESKEGKGSVLLGKSALFPQKERNF